MKVEVVKREDSTPNHHVYVDVSGEIWILVVEHQQATKKLFRCHKLSNPAIWWTAWSESASVATIDLNPFNGTLKVTV